MVSKKFKLKSCLTILVSLNICGMSSEVKAREVFNPAFLNDLSAAGNRIDLSAYEYGNSQAPGIYKVDVYINNAFIETADVEFKSSTTNKTELIPCFTQEKLNSYGVRTKAIKNLRADENGCVDLKQIPEASSKFNFNLQQLKISLPQAALVASVRGFVDPAEYDNGINSLFLNYRAYGSKGYARDDNDDNESYSLNLLPGLNIGAWRLRNYTTWNKSSGSDDDKWDNVYTYAERTIIPLKSVLTIGEKFSPSDIFDSVPFKGVQLATDDNMDPESIQGYAPVVRGIAKTNAKVIIKQNDYVIYQSFVPPGAFEITDLYSTGGSGDLDVIVEESDGSKQQFVVPYASLPVLRREGSLKYSVTSGVYRPADSDVDETPFTQATASYGLPLSTTIYGGFQASSKYQSITAGIGKNLGDIGAVSFDVTQAWSSPHNREDISGQSLRFRYSKNLSSTGTNVSIAGYRYSTSGYLTLNDTFDTYGNGYSFGAIDRLKNRSELTISQNLPDGWGYINIGGLIEDYWNQKRQTTSANISYSNSWKGASYTLNYAYNRSSVKYTGSDRRHEDEKIFSLNVTVPFTAFMNNTWLNYGMTSASPGSTANTVGISGTALEGQNLSWNIQQGYDNRDYASGSTGLDYKGTYGEIYGNYDYDNSWQHLNYGASGSMILHSDGLTFGQSFSDSAILVKAPGVADTRITNDVGVITDARGYTIVPDVSLYRRNDISLDTETMPADVEIEVATASVVPTRGSITRAEFDANVGIRAILTLMDPTGKKIPFGATVTYLSKTTGKSSSGIVSDDGQVYMSGLDESGVLQVQWGRKAQEQCKAPYKLNATNAIQGITQTETTCR